MREFDDNSRRHHAYGIGITELGSQQDQEWTESLASGLHEVAGCIGDELVL
jgi:hypothetical protein